MKIVALQWFRYAIPLRSAMPTAHGTLTTREGAIIALTTSSGITGYGEAAPLPSFGGDDLATAIAAFPGLAAQLHQKDLDEALALVQSWHLLPSSTRYGFETALFDALGQLRGESVCSMLSQHGIRPRTSVGVNATVGTTSIEQAVKCARAAAAAGFGCIKLKLGTEPYRDIERVAAVRAALGPNIHLRLDANEGWSFDQAVTILDACTPYAVQYVEQPLLRDDLASMRDLRRRVSIPIAADEAIMGLESARRVLATQSADVLMIKPQLAGGLRTAQQIIHEAAEHGIQSVITSTMDAGIGVAAALHLAAATPAITLECGLATLDLFADDLIHHALDSECGYMRLPSLPGLGVYLDKLSLARYTVNSG